MAERVGFEPTVRSRVQRFSRPPRSTTPAPLRKALGSKERRTLQDGDISRNQAQLFLE